MVCPWHRFLVNHKTPQIYVISSRNLQDLSELDPFPTASVYNWKIPKKFPFTSTIDATSFINSQNPFQIKGLIGISSNFERFAISSSLYIAMSLFTDFTTVGDLNWKADLDEKHAFDIVRSGCIKKAIHYFPKWKGYLEEISKKFQGMCSEIQKVYEEIQLLDMKDFGKKSSNFWFKFLLFLFKKENWQSANEYYGLQPFKELSKSLQFASNQHK
jgi:hypothetical protein